MSIFWRGPQFYDRSEEEQYALSLTEWVVDTWKLLAFPLNRYQLPLLPGLYSVYGKFQPYHLKLPNLCQRPLTVEETLPNWITERQRQTGFGTFLYIGTSECLYTRWESHHKKKAIRHLFNNGVVVHFYFYAMLPSHNHFQEDKIERANRCELEKRLIYYLCPILGDPKRWGGFAKN